MKNFFAYHFLDFGRRFIKLKAALDAARFESCMASKVPLKPSPDELYAVSGHAPSRKGDAGITYLLSTIEMGEPLARFNFPQKFLVLGVG